MLASCDTRPNSVAESPSNPEHAGNTRLSVSVASKLSHQVFSVPLIDDDFSPASAAFDDANSCFVSLVPPSSYSVSKCQCRSWAVVIAWLSVSEESVMEASVKGHSGYSRAMSNPFHDKTSQTSQPRPASLITSLQRIGLLQPMGDESSLCWRVNACREVRLY